MSTTMRSALADEMRAAAQALAALAAGERLDFALEEAERVHDLAPDSRLWSVILPIPQPGCWVSARRLPEA